MSTWLNGWSATVVVLAAATISASPASAQERDRDRERDSERCECIRFDADHWPGGTALRTIFGNRGRLGVTLSSDSATQSVGARIDDITEDGPAAKAGLREGDIITAINGRSVTDRGEGERRRSPSARTVELLRDVEPGDTVRVDYRRGNERRSASVIAGDLGGWPLTIGRLNAMPRSFRVPEVHVGPMVEGQARSFIRMRAQGVELVDMNAGLESYFGTRAGALVLDADDDSRLNLRAGDVITRIGGREVRNAAHAYRILSSYNEDEDVSIEIMRQKARQTVTGRLR